MDFGQPFHPRPTVDRAVHDQVCVEFSAGERRHRHADAEGYVLPGRARRDPGQQRGAGEQPPVQFQLHFACAEHRHILAVARQDPPLGEREVFGGERKLIAIRFQQGDDRADMLGQDQQVDILAVLLRDRAIGKHAEHHALDRQHGITRRFDQPHHPHCLAGRDEVEIEDLASRLRDPRRDRDGYVDGAAFERGIDQAGNTLAQHDLREAVPVRDLRGGIADRRVARCRGRPAAARGGEHQLRIGGRGHAPRLGF